MLAENVGNSMELPQIATNITAICMIQQSHLHCLCSVIGGKNLVASGKSGRNKNMFHVFPHPRLFLGLELPWVSSYPGIAGSWDWRNTHLVLVWTTWKDLDASELFHFVPSLQLSKEAAFCGELLGTGNFFPRTLFIYLYIKFRATLEGGISLRTVKPRQIWALVCAQWQSRGAAVEIGLSVLCWSYLQNIFSFWSSIRRGLYRLSFSQMSFPSRFH